MENTTNSVNENVNQPVVIKRYQNRKLYNTNTSTYVTLESLANLVKAGNSLQVIDNKTKNDITNKTYFQIRNLLDQTTILSRPDAGEILLASIRNR